MSRNWKSVMDMSWDEIHKDIKTGLDVLKRDFESKGLPFDEKFRNLFCKSISNRLAEVYHIFEMEEADSKPKRTHKRKKPISNESKNSKRRKCDNDILPKWAFACAHCYSQNGQNDWYANEKKVHKHWQNNHSNGDELPFRFYVDCTVQCYRCGLCGFFEKIQDHSRKKHNRFLVLTKVKKRKSRECALCWHRDCDGNIEDHFQHVHSNDIDSMDPLNPIPFSDRDLMELNAICTYDLRCSYCKRSYKTQIDFNQHHRAKHPGKQPKYGEIKLICCFCGKNVQCDEFLLHIKQCEIFKCNKCRHFQAKTPQTFLHHIKEMHWNDLNNGFYSRLRRSLMNKYLSMRCIFENGLVVTKRNLIDSRFDDKNEFMNLIVDSVNELRMLAKRSDSNES